MGNSSSSTARGARRDPTEPIKPRRRTKARRLVGSSASVAGSQAVQTIKKSKKKVNRIFPNVSFTNDDTSCAIFGSFFELKQIKLLTKEARSRQAFDIRRLSFLSCSLGLDCDPQILTQKLLKFFEGHAPNMEWLIITGPMLLENNDQACQIINYLTAQKSRATQLQRLGLGLAAPANVELATALVKLLEYPGSALSHLNLHSMSWKNKRALRVLGQGIAGSDELKWLDMSNCRITDEGFHEFVEAITTSKDVGLESINLKGNNLTSAALPDLARLISACQGQLRTLHLSDMTALFQEATSEQMSVFLSALQTTTTTTKRTIASLQELCLSNTGMDSQVMKHILEHIARQSSETGHCGGNSKSLERLDLSHNLVPLRMAQELLACYLERLPKSLKVLSIVSSKTVEEQRDEQNRDDDEEDDGNDMAEREAQLRIVETRNAVRQALHSNSNLTQLRVFDPKMLSKEKQRQQHESKREGCHQERQSTPVSSFSTAADDRILGDGEWYQTKIQPILQRNALAEHLNQSTLNEPPLAVWPHYLSRQCSDSDTTSATPRKGDRPNAVAHPPSIVYQVLQRHLTAVATC